MLVPVRSLSACVAALVFCLAVAPARADAIEDYSFYRIAAGLDDICRYLKHVERTTIEELAFDRLSTTGQYAHSLDGRMSNEDYLAWLDGIHAAADARALEIGCTKAAEPYLLQSRGAASATILQRLLLAFHFNSLPEDDYNRRGLHPDEIAGAQSYEGFLQQVYQDKFPAFFEAQKQAAAASLPQVLPPCSPLLAPDVPCDVFGVQSFDPEISAKLSEAQQKALTIRDVHFEVVAETAGYRLWASRVQKYFMAANLMGLKTSALYATVVAGPGTFKLEGGGQVFGIIAQSAEGRLRFMSYGTEAEKLRGGIVRLFVRSEDAPQGVAGWEIFNLDDFRSLAFPFDGAPLSDECLGGPCWEFSKEAVEAISHTGFDEKAELWLAADPAAVPAATRYWLDANSFYPQLMRRLNGEEPPKAN